MDRLAVTELVIYVLVAGLLILLVWSVVDALRREDDPVETLPEFLARRDRERVLDLDRYFGEAAEGFDTGDVA